VTAAATTWEPALHCLTYPSPTPPSNPPRPNRLPAYLQLHFPPSTSVLEEVETQERWRDLRSVLSAHSNVKLLLSGHFHKVGVGSRAYWGAGLAWLGPAFATAGARQTFNPLA